MRNSARGLAQLKSDRCKMHNEIQVIPIPLDITFPKRRLGFVVLQPFLEFSPKAEPFRQNSSSKGRQLSAINRTLSIAFNRTHGYEKTHFVVFPEYSVPGPHGLKLIEDTMANMSWPIETVIIACMDGLTSDEYEEIWRESSTQRVGAAQPEAIGHYWVNCCAILIKTKTGSILKWLQPKLHPAQVEHSAQTCNMFRGKNVFLFNCGLMETTLRFHFLVMICFDLIAGAGNDKALTNVMENIQSQWAGGGCQTLNLFFVPQYNHSPNHQEFLNETARYFIDRDKYPNIDRRDSIIIFSNASGRKHPGVSDSFGRSSIVFAPDANIENRGCLMTYAMHTKKLRGNNFLESCREALFRENGACIHSFGLTMPKFVNPNRADVSYPMEPALVHPIDEKENDLRTPNAPVPALVKWLNDRLDSIRIIKSMPSFDNGNAFEKAHSAVVKAIRGKKPDLLEACCYCAAPDIEKPPKGDRIAGVPRHQVDEWDEGEEDRLIFTVQVLSLLHRYHPIDIAESAVHGSLDYKGIRYQLVVIRSSTHDDARKHAELLGELVVAERLLVISDDADHGPPYGDPRYDMVETPIGLETIITDPFSKFIWRDYHSLIALTKRTKDEATFNAAVETFLGGQG